jgi:hypothetical protein
MCLSGNTGFARASARDKKVEIVVSAKNDRQWEQQFFHGVLENSNLTKE